MSNGRVGIAWYQIEQFMSSSFFREIPVQQTAAISIEHMENGVCVRTGPTGIRITVRHKLADRASILGGPTPSSWERWLNQDH
jgi:hypothetical protein